MTPSELRVAIAAESDVFDRGVYGHLLALILEIPIWPYETDMLFGGRTRVRREADAFLDRAFRDGVRHALFAVDNDGGLKRRPEHDDAHEPDAQVGQDFKDANDACSICLLERSISPRWREKGGLLCLAAPIQTIETWLLWLRNHDFGGRPELTFHRKVLKKLLYNGPEPPAPVRLELALEALARPDALVRLRERPSFVRFEQQARAWLTAGETTAPAP